MLHPGFLNYETENPSGRIPILIGCDNNIKENKKKLMTIGKRMNHFHSTTSTRQKYVLMAI